MSPAILRQSTTSPKIVCSPSFGKEASIVEKCWQKSLCLVSFVWGVRAVSHSCREIEQPKYLYYLLLLLKISKYLQYFQFFPEKETKQMPTIWNLSFKGNWTAKIFVLFATSPQNIKIPPSSIFSRKETKLTSNIWNMSHNGKNSQNICIICYFSSKYQNISSISHFFKKKEAKQMRDIWNLSYEQK